MRIGRALLAICAALAVSGLGAAPATAQEAARPDPVEARQAIAEAMAADHVPALSVAVYRGDDLVWSEAFGEANIENHAPARTDHLFRIGSVSKVFTATLAARLAQQGLIDLDRPIRDYLSDWPERHPPITLRQLLGHLGGVRHYIGRDFDGSQPGGRNDLRLYPDRASILALFANDDLVAPPGEGFHYTTFGYTLAGLVIEAATGEDFETLLNEHLLAPAGITDVRVDNFFAIVPGRVENYDPAEDYGDAVPADAGPVVNAMPLNSAYKIPGGGLVADAEAVARFGTLIFEAGFLTEDAYREMLTSQRNAAGEVTGVGLGWRIGADAAGRTLFHHSGSQQGSRAHIAVYPEERLSVAILTNLGNRPRDIAALSAAVAADFLD